MSDSSNETLLAGVRVVELEHGLGASLLGMLLAEQGAEVVRVLPPEREVVDPVLDALLARGKVEVTLDGRDPGQAQRLERLLRQADVALVEQGGGAAPDLERLREAHNPGLISCRIPAFPDEDPRADLPPHEAVAGAAGFLYNKPLGRPRYHQFPIGSVTAALYAANAVVAALIARMSLGRGQQIEVPRYHANLTSQVVQILVKAGVPRGFLPLKMIGSPFMRCWLCQDDRHVYLHITLPTHNARMLELLEQGGYAAEVKQLRRIMSPETMRDPSQVKSIAEAKKIKAIYTEIFRSRPAQHWEEALGQELCCIKVRTVEEWLEDSLEAGMTDSCRVDDPVFGPLLGPGPSVSSPQHPPVVTPRVQDPQRFEALLAAWEAEPRPATAPRGRTELSHALDGVKVLDLSRVIAGPCAARVLAELGADVISLQSETRLDWALSFHLIFNAGKRSVTLDFTTDEGKERLWRLIDWFQPDVLVHNYRHLDLARAIGVGPEAMLERYPQLAYTHLNAYGNDGVWKDRPGFEQVVQAVSGIQMAYAEGGRPKLLPSPIIDIGCGLLGAFGTLLALYNRRRTGKGAVTTTHLTSVSVLLQLLSVSAFQRGECLQRAARRGQAPRHDRDAEVVADIFWTLGGLACLCGPRRDLRRWLRHAGLSRADGLLAGHELQEAGRHLFKRPVSHWQRTLEDAGVQDTVALLPYPSIRKIADEIPRYDPRPRPVVRKRSFPGSPSDLTFVANPVRMSATPLADVAPPPERGGDTAAVMGEIGVALPERSGVIDYPPNKPLLVWLASFVRWGYFAWKSGNI